MSGYFTTLLLTHHMLLLRFMFFKGSWFYKLVFSCDGKMVNIDSCESIRTCSNNGKWLLDVMSKGQNGMFC